MIEFEKFFIPHIGKTGGDSIKAICKEMNLPITICGPENNKGFFEGNQDLLEYDKLMK